MQLLIDLLSLHTIVLGRWCLPAREQTIEESFNAGFLVLVDLGLFLQSLRGVRVGR